MTQDELVTALTQLNTLITNMKTSVKQYLKNPNDQNHLNLQNHLNRDHMGQIMLWVYANQPKSQPRNTDIYADRRGYGN